ncbi:hypothetical protein ES702_02256 [subsurface metagenome]
MKKLLVIFILLTIFLSGCGVFNLNDFVLPDDIKFIETIETLDTPKKICQYMKDNFDYKENIFYNPDPYTLWLTHEGDCNDFCTWAIFVADYHKYETYQIFIYFKGTFIRHVLAVYTENDKYSYSNIKAYCPICASSFDEIISHYFINHELKLNYYKVYDYYNNLVEKGTND